MAKQIHFSKNQAAAARSLAIRYSAFEDAKWVLRSSLVARFEDANSVVVWGDMLARAQVQTGIEVLPIDLIEGAMEAALFDQHAALRSLATFVRSALV